MTSTPTPVAPVEGSDAPRTPTAVKILSASQGVTPGTAADGPTEVELKDVSCFYGAFRAVRNVDVVVPRNKVTAFIGPSGCGKSTVLRTINRMNDLVPIFRLEGKILFEGQDLYRSGADAVDIRRRIGMVFQKPNPFPKTIFDNVAFGPRINGYKGDIADLVEHSLRRAALWDEVKD